MDIDLQYESVESSPDLLLIPYGELHYLESIWTLLYSGHPVESISQKIKAIPLSTGVCAKPFTKEDVGWFCQKCQKDHNCVICQLCFEHSQHQGHPVYLKRTVHGCCDCGDHEAWDPKGFCEHHQGFIDEASANFSLLPAEIRESARDTISKLAVRLFSICMCFLVSGEDKDSALEEEIAALLNNFQKISDVSPIFLYEVCRNFAHGRDKYKQQSAEGGMQEVSLGKQKNLLDLLIAVHYKLNQPLRKFVINFCINHLKSRGFKFALAEAYLKNYKKVLLNDSIISQNSISSLGCQVLGSEEIAPKLLCEEKYMGRLINVVKLRIMEFVSHPVRMNYYNFQQCRYDVLHLIKASSAPLFLKSALLQELIEASSKAAYLNTLPVVLEHTPYEIEQIPTSIEFEKTIMKIFGYIARCANYEDTEWCKRMAASFKRFIGDSYKRAIALKDAFFNIPLHRCLSFFLTNYVYTQGILHMKSVEKPALGFYMRKILKELFEIPDDQEYVAFLKMLMYPLLQTIGLTLEVSAGKWIRYGLSIDSMLHLYMDYSLGFGRYDLSLLQILLASYTETTKEPIIEFIVESLSQQGKWLRYYLWLLTDENIAEETVEKSLIESGIDKRKVKSILEQALFLLCGLCSNDFLGLPIFLKGIKPKIVKQPYYQLLAHIVDKIQVHALKKELVHAYFKCKTPWVTIPMLLEHLPKYFRKYSGIEGVVREISEILKDNVKGTETYRVKPEAYEMYDPFYYVLQGNIGFADEKAEEIFRKNGTSKNFNPVFGNNNNKCEDSIDMCYAVNQVLTSGGIHKILRALIKRGAREEGITDNTMIYTLKLLKLTKLDTTFEDMPIKDVLKKLTEKIPHYAKLFTEYQSVPLAADPLEKEKVDIKAKQRKIMEEFKGKFASFAAKHTKVLEKIEPSTDTVNCGICKENLVTENFCDNPYGKLVYMSVSGTYCSYLRQGISEKDYSYLNEEFNVQTKGLIIQSCGHYMHYKCIMKPEWGLTRKECPLCGTPITYIIPINECIEKLKRAKLRELKVVTNILDIIKQKHERTEKIPGGKENDWLYLVEIISTMACYKVKANSLCGLNDFSKNMDFLHPLLHLARAFRLKKSVDEYEPGKVLASIMNRIQTNEILLNQTLDQDYLKLAAYILSLLKLKGNHEMDAGDKIVLFFLRLHLWQIIAKLSLEQALPIKDKKILASLIEAQKQKIKQLAYPWLIKAFVLKLWLFQPDTMQAVKNSLDSAATFDDVIRFEMVAELLGYPKDSLLDSFVDCPNKFLLCSAESIEFTADKMLELIAKEVNNLENNGIKVPIQLLIIFPLKEFAWTELEEDYMELQKIHYKRKCKKCSRQVKANALCLLCGEILCCRQECCMYGTKDEVWYHAQTCSAGTGIFLYFWINQIILISNSESAIYPSPYTNQYGESVDVSKKITFEPIKLNHAMLQGLKTMYLEDKVHYTVKNMKRQGMGAIL